MTVACAASVDLIDDKGEGKFQSRTVPGDMPLFARALGSLPQPPPIPGWLLNETNFLANALAAVLFEVLLRFERGHAAGAGGGDGLAIAAVLHVAAGVDAGHDRLHCA